MYIYKTDVCDIRSSGPHSVRDEARAPRGAPFGPRTGVGGLDFSGLRDSLDWGLGGQFHVALFLCMRLRVRDHAFYQLSCA